MKQVHYPDIESLDSLLLGLTGSKNMKVKIISDDTVCLEIGPDGYTPDHGHEDKERVVVISGEGSVLSGKERKPIHPGDFLEFAPNEQHQLINSGDTPLELLCLRNQR